MKIIPLAALGMALFGATTGANAQTYNFTLDKNKSVLNATTSISVKTAGSLIGQYDASTNPNGTRTKPGVSGSWGSTINDPVPSNPSVSAGGLLQSSSTGSYRLAVDLANNKVTLSNYAVNFLASGPVSQSASMAMNTSGFRTKNPTWTYAAGMMTVPLGSLTINTLAATQRSGTSVAGKLTATSPNTYTFSLAFTADLALSFTIMGTSSGVRTAAIPMWLNGTLTLNSNGTATVSSSVSLNGSKTYAMNYVVPKFALTAPAGTQTASFWMNMTLSQLVAGVQGTYATFANGVKP